MVGRGFPFLQIDICILGCQLSCPFYIHLENIFKFVAVKILLHCLKRLTFFAEFPRKLCRLSVMILCTICNYTHTHTHTHTKLPFDVHRVVHCNIISTVKPTRRTNVSNLFYFGMIIYMFRTVFPSIIRSSRLYIQQQAFVI